MGESKPPSRSLQLTLFRIGQDRDGHWVAQDERGLCGGLFVNRAEALKFALFENGKHPEAVITVPGVLELELNRKVGAADQGAIDAEVRLAA